MKTLETMETITRILKLSFDSNKDKIITYNYTVVIRRKNCFCVIDFNKGKFRILIDGNLIFEESIADFESIQKALSNFWNKKFTEDDEFAFHDLGNTIAEIWEKIIS